MKKRVLGLLAAVAAVIGIAAIVLFGKKMPEAYAADTHEHCVCGTNTAIGDHTTHSTKTWTAWTSTTTMPTISNIPSGATEGYFYLTSDITVGDSTEMFFKWDLADAEGKKVNVCLNGHTITAGAKRFMASLMSWSNSAGNHTMNATYTLTDCAATPGKLVRTKSYTATGSLFWLDANSASNTTALINSAVNVYNITIQGTGATADSTLNNGSFFAFGSNNKGNFYNVTIDGFGTKGSFGVVSAYGTSQVNFYGSTIKNVTAPTGAIQASSSATINFSDGLVEDCTGNYGGAFYGANNAVINLSNTTVKNCYSTIWGGVAHLCDNAKLTATNNCLFDGNKAKQKGGAFTLSNTSSLELSDTVISGCVAETQQGGGIYSTSTGTIDLKSGTVLNGNKTLASTANGGNMFLDKGSVNMYAGAKVINGIAQNITGNVQVAGSTVFHMYGGEISGGKEKGGSSEGETANVHFYSNDGTFIMEGGTVAGHFFVRAAKDFTLKGSAKITGSAGVGLVLDNTYYNTATDFAQVYNVHFGPFNDDASIFFARLTTTGNEATATAAGLTSYQKNWNNILQNGVDYSVKKHFDSDNYVVVVVDSNSDGIGDRLMYYSKAGSYAHTHCICGGNLEDGKTYGTGANAYTHHCADITFTKLTVSGGQFTHPTTSGNYYLPEDANLPYGGTAYGVNINLCFGGHTATLKQYRVFQTNAVPSGKTAAQAASHIQYTDCVGDGGVKDGTAANTDQGALFWTSASIPSTFKIFGGVYDFSTRPFTGAGAVINLMEARLDLYNGTIIGTSATAAKAAAGNIYAYGNSVVNIYGGTITGGKAAGTTTALTTARGGNVRLNGTSTLNIFGGTIEGGTATEGGNISIDAGTCNIYGGVITGGNATNIGGNIYSAGTLNIYGGEISDGVAKLNGGNIRTAGGTATISGGVIKDGVSNTATECCNAFFVGTKNVTISGGEFLTDDTTHSNVWVHQGCTAASITGGYFQGYIHGTERTSYSFPAFISGGFFETAPDEYTLKDHYIVSALDPAVVEGGNSYLYTIVAGNKLLLTSCSTLFGSDVNTRFANSIAPLIGGGDYATGTSITIGASDVPGYTFVGWYENAYEGSPIAVTKQYTFENGITENTTLVAAYRFDNSTVSYSVKAEEFYIAFGDGEYEHCYGSKTGTVPYGTVIHLSDYSKAGFATNSICRWTNGSGKVVGDSYSYEGALYSDSEFIGVQTPTSGPVVAFVSIYGQVVKAISGVKTITDADFPAVPTVYGKTGGYWHRDAAEINEYLAVPTVIYIQVNAVGYESANEEVTVTVQGATTDGQTWTNVGEAVSVKTKTNAYANLKAPTVSGKTFLYFATGEAANPTILSYSDTYKLEVSDDLTVYAVFGDEAVENKNPTIAITVNSATLNGTKYTLSIGATRVMTEGYELVEQGILFAVGSSTMTAEVAKDTLYVGGTANKFTSTNMEDNSVSVLNVKNAPAGAVIYAKGYMVVRKTGTDELDVIYTDLATCTAE